MQKEKFALESIINRVSKQESLLEEAQIAIELSEEDNDDDTIKEAVSVIEQIKKEIDRLEFERMLSGEADQQNAIISINSGAGGTESQDWTEMLLRMYLRYCERRNIDTRIVDELPGDEAGIKSITFIANGSYAYGYLKAEAGIHRLVRISPFDSNSRRHTSFASVFVLPEADETIDIEINESELKIDTYRASGAGGQHVNKTSSAVRITHTPTGIVVQCQNERSQFKNKSTAMKILKSRLYEKELREREAEMAEVHSTKKEIAWGSQIRSYVLHPYRMVKDLRTNLEVGNVDAVLDGKIHQFIEAYLISVGE